MTPGTVRESTLTGGLVSRQRSTLALLALLALAGAWFLSRQLQRSERSRSTVEKGADLPASSPAESLVPAVAAAGEWVEVPAERTPANPSASPATNEAWVVVRVIAQETDEVLEGIPARVSWRVKGTSPKARVGEVSRTVEQYRMAGTTQETDKQGRVEFVVVAGEDLFAERERPRLDEGRSCRPGCPGALTARAA